MKKWGLEEKQTMRLQQLLRELHEERRDEEQESRHCREVRRAVRIHAEKSGEQQQAGLSIFSELGWAPAYTGVALLLLIATIQFYKTEAPSSDSVAQLPLSQEVVDELDEEKAYPNLPENIRLFSPPTGGNGTILPAQFQEK
jgi:hypothetical protein